MPIGLYIDEPVSSMTSNYLQDSFTNIQVDSTSLSTDYGSIFHLFEFNENHISIGQCKFEEIKYLSVKLYIPSYSNILSQDS